MNTVIEIPAGEVPTTLAEQELRVSVYCRVSTKYEQQLSSLENQANAYQAMIAQNTNWTLVEIYQEQESATNLTNRKEFNKMLDKCRKGEIDLILTKSISRFGRNTLDTLRTLQELKIRNIAVYFETERLNSMNTDLNIQRIITICAAVAQEESYEKSESIKWGIKASASRGNVKLNYTNFLGYTKDADGNLIVVPEEAEIVKLIYSLYLNGCGCRKIKKHLENNGIKTVTGKAVWSTSTIDRILSNEKYCGDSLSQKTYVKDFLNVKQVKNNGELEQVYVRKSHEAIIDRDAWNKVQKMKGMM